LRNWYNDRLSMRIAVVSAAALTLALLHASPALAQDPPRPIGPFVIDVRGTRPKFPSSDGLAASRGLLVTELPGSGFGIDFGAHVYPLKWKAVTFGVGGQITLARSHGSGEQQGGLVVARAVTEEFRAIAPQISFNFGSGSGWSYLSGGVGPGVWSIVPDGSQPLPADDERLKVYNYGGGARWFAKKHLAFTFDVRFFDVYPGSPELGYPGSPRVKMLVMSAGVSVK
jgi:hypothetical protein